MKSDTHNVFYGKTNKIALSSNDDKECNQIHSIETYAYGTSKDLVSEKEEIIIFFNKKLNLKIW